jgi:hypothetical protein
MVLQVDQTGEWLCNMIDFGLICFGTMQTKTMRKKRRINQIKSNQKGSDTSQQAEQTTETTTEATKQFSNQRRQTITTTTTHQILEFRHVCLLRMKMKRG